MLLFHRIDLRLLLLHDFWELYFILKFRDDFVVAIDVFSRLLARLPYSKVI